MKKIKTSICIILLIYCASCTNEQKKSRYTNEQISSLQLGSTEILKVLNDSAIKINLNPFLQKQSFDFGSLVKEVKLIPLETTDESLLDNIYKIIATDSCIYIQDNFKGGGIVIFDNKGKFITRITNGAGPGELSRLYDITFDKESNELIAYQHSYLLFYTPKGEFIRQKKLPFGFYNFAVIPDGYIFKTLDEQGNKHLGKLGSYTLLITDKNFKMKSVGLSYPPFGKVLGAYNYLHGNSSIKITHGYTDTIYQYINETNQLKAIYIIDYSKKRLPSRYTQSKTRGEFENAVKQNDYYFNIGEYLETKTHNVFFLQNQYIGLRTIIYRDKQSGHLTGGTSADFNSNEIPPIGFAKAATDNYLISSYLPESSNTYLSNSHIISDEDKKKIKGLNEDDNPVLVFFKLKKF